jgi:hypothetical protein
MFSNFETFLATRFPANKRPKRVFQQPQAIALKTPKSNGPKAYLRYGDVSQLDLRNCP